MKAILMGDNEQLLAAAKGVLARLHWETQVGSLKNLEQGGQDRQAKSVPDAVIIQLPLDEQTFSQVDRLRRSTTAKIVIVGPAANPSLILKLLHEGGGDQYVDEANLECELITVMRRLFAIPKGRVVAVVAPGGGAGASTLAVNLAESFAQIHQSAALLDLNLCFGDLAALLDVQPSFSIVDVAHNLSRLDGQLFRQLLTPCASGVQLLAAPQQIDELKLVTPEVVEAAVEFSRQFYPRVVLDIDPDWSAEQVRALRTADLLLLLMRLDFSILHNVRRGLTFLNKCEIDASKVRLICNFEGRSSELSESDVEKIVGLKIFEHLPDDQKNVIQANNVGVPVVIGAPSSPFSRQVRHLAQQLETQCV